LRVGLPKQRRCLENKKLAAVWQRSKAAQCRPWTGSKSPLAFVGSWAGETTAFHPEADEEHANAAEYYTRIEPELGQRFYDEIELQPKHSISHL
jgi:hypothetical protein